MDYKEYPPVHQLSPLIECFWSNTLFEEDIQHSFDFIIPDGTTDAIIMIQGNYLRQDDHQSSADLIEQCSLIPPFKKAVKVFQKPGTTVLGIRFKPGAIQQLTGISLSDFDDAAYPLELIFPELADLSMDEVQKRTPIPILIQKITRLMERLNLQTPNNILAQQFISATVQQEGNILIQYFCDKFNVHKSTLEKSFKHQTGLTPKQYAKIVRHNYLLNRIMYSSKSLTEISHAMGFYDQSHMIKDFTGFVGITPTDFRELKLSVPKMMAASVLNRSNYYR